MGVPKFYRWISERYPCLSEVINDTQIPEFDNLYLDMNGIIHNCSHPNDDDVTFRITEEQILVDIFAYIEKLFRTIRPQKVFYMAVDGVAPRAKMNQQRARRFMSARTAQEQLDKARAKGEEIPTEKRFDSNCITPGTYFMTKLHNELAAWVERKINTDAAWQGIRVYLSGHDCPGEGEHKIMDFIRAERISEGYDPNTRHCMYGLDADLIMLGICSHEPHFSLLREEVKFNRPMKQGNKKKKAPPKPRPTEITFHLLHLSLLREYLSWEFHDVKDKLSFDYDMERIVDDWVLMGFLVGNDFIPHLPHVHIHDDALPLLYATYKEVLPTLDGYLNESGTLNLKRFEVFLKAVAQNDKASFMQVMEDSDFLRAKRGNVAPGQFEALIEGSAHEEELVAFEDSDMSESEASTPSDDDADDNGEVSDDELEDEDMAAFVSSDEEAEDDTQLSAADAIAQFELASAAELLSGANFDPVEDEFAEAIALAEFKQMDDKEFENNVENCWSRSVGNSFKRHKRDYYREKMKYGNITKDELRRQSEGYVRAIQWVLHYYYHGCVSWNWYFAHHYAPYISDVVDFSSMEMNFELSEPFRPFEQLLAVLPAASAECLPVPLRSLMCSAESPIADFYPKDFETDLNGKKNDWEAVVLIPFIDEKRLLSAIQEKEHLLSNEEKQRNSHGPHILLTTDTEKPAGHWAVRTLVDKDLFRLPESEVVWGLLPNVKLDVYFPGFPTMKHLPHTAVLKEVNVNIFQQPSRKPSMVLKVGKREEMEKDLLEVAFELIGKKVCIDWPVLKMGLVDSVWGLESKYQRQKYDEVTMIHLTDEEKNSTRKLLLDLKDRLIHRYAIDAEHAQAVVYVRRFLGVTYEVRDGVLCPVKQWGGAETAVPVILPLLVTNVMVEEGTRLSEIPVEKAYPVKAKVFVMEPNWAGFGFPAIVNSIQDSGSSSCRVVVLSAIFPQPDVSAIATAYDDRSLPWFSGYEVGKRSGVHGKLVGRLTGFMFLFNGERNEAERGAGMQEKMNIGLALKLTKKNQEVPDYTRRTADGYWQYSLLCVRLLIEYKNKFRDLITFLERSDNAEDVYYASDIWSNEVTRKEKWQQLADFLGSIPTSGIEKQEGGTYYVDSMMIGHLETAIQLVAAQKLAPKMTKSSVNPSKLYRAELMDGKVRPDSEADFQLLDRVVNTVSGIVPLGYQGTIIGLHGDKIEVLFDKEFTNGYKRGQWSSCARVPVAALINITFGKERKGKSPSKRDTRKGQKQQQTQAEKPRMGAGRDRERAGRQSAAQSSHSSTFVEGPSEPWVPKQQRKGDTKKANQHETPKSGRGDYGAPPAQMRIMRKGETGKPPKQETVKAENVEDKLAQLLGLTNLKTAADNVKETKEVVVDAASKSKDSGTSLAATPQEKPNGLELLFQSAKESASESILPVSSNGATTEVTKTPDVPAHSVPNAKYLPKAPRGKTEHHSNIETKNRDGGAPDSWMNRGRGSGRGFRGARGGPSPNHHFPLPPPFFGPVPMGMPPPMPFGAPPPGCHMTPNGPFLAGSPQMRGQGPHYPYTGGPQFTPRGGARTFHRSSTGNQQGDPRLTDLKPSTVSKPFSSKRGRGRGASTRGTPLAPSSQVESKKEVVVDLPDKKKIEDSSEPKENMPSGKSTGKKPRVSRLAAKFAAEK